jgi:ABC-type oligopeptide transport system substrate-binding subunit
MNRMQKRLMTWAAALCLLFSLCVAPALAKPQTGSPADQTTSTSKKKKQSKKSSAPPDSQPTAASDSGSASASGATASSFVSPAPAGKSSSKVVASEAEITAAKASGKVWVNLDSGVYHKRGRWYGKTKNGRFMTPDEAKKAGYRQAKRE